MAQYRNNHIQCSTGALLKKILKRLEARWNGCFPSKPCKPSLVFNFLLLCLPRAVGFALVFMPQCDQIVAILVYFLKRSCCHFCLQNILFSCVILPFYPYYLESQNHRNAEVGRDL